MGVATSVKDVADHRATRLAQVDADLVGPAGDRPGEHQRTLAHDLKQFEVGLRLLAIPAAERLLLEMDSSDAGRDHVDLGRKACGSAD